MQVITSTYQHSLGAGVSFVHPKNGNIYIAACVKVTDVQQHLIVYRLRSNTTSLEIVKQYLGGGIKGAISPGQVTMGHLVIRQDGTMVIAFSAPTFAKPNQWVPQFDIVPGIDEPWSPSSGGVVNVQSAPVTSGNDSRIDDLLLRLSRAEKEIATLKQRPVPLTAIQIAEIAWTKANDAIFASTQANGYLSGWAWQKALDAAYSFCKSRGLVL